MADINMRQIEIFLAVAKYQNISKAAQELYTSQPSISNWIAKMEEECGFRLFNRTNRGAILTPRGEELYARLDIAYHRFRVSVEEILNNHNGDGDTLRIGILNRFDAMNVADEQMKAYAIQYPDRRQTGERFNFHELRNKLLCNELDLIFTLSFDIDPYPDFASIPICDFPAFFIVPNEWEADLTQNPGVDALSGKTLIIEAPTQRPWAEKVCASYGIVPSDVRYVNSYILMSALIARAEGFSIDGKIITDGIYSPTTALLPVSRVHSSKVVMAWPKDRIAPQAAEFIKFLSGGLMPNSDGTLDL